MFDGLTFDELYALNTTLFDQGTRVHRRMVSPDGHALIHPLSDTWAVLSAWHAELGETQAAVCEELHRRAGETHADV